MTTRTLDIIYNQSGNAKAGTDALVGSLQKVDPAAKKASGATDNLSGSIKGLVGQYGPALGIAGVAAAIGSYGVESSKAAMQSGRLENATDKLGARFGLTGDQIVASMKAASLGTINEMAAMEKANLAMSLGVIKSADDFKVLTEGAAVLGRAVGLDATQALDSLVIGLGRGSTEVLDNLGITLKAAEAQEIYAARLGKTASDLTEVEKKEAFQAVALEKIKEKTAELGGLQEDQLAKLERSSAAWADLQVKSGEVLNTFVEATGVLDGLNGVMGYMLENVTAVSEAMDQGLGAGLLQVFDNANPVTQLLERFGVDVIPDFVAASGEATAAVNTQADAHATATSAIAEQEQAIQGLALSQIETLADLGQLEEAYNEKKEKLLNDRVEAESSASEQSAENSRTLNEKLQQNEQDRINRIAEINERAAQDRDRNSGAEYQKDIEKANKHFDEKRTKIQESYTEENNEIKAKLDERQQAIDEQLRKEEEAYKKKAEELKLVMAAQVLEQSGQLEEMTGIAGITAEQYVQAVKYGAIEANKQVENEMRNIVRGFEGAQRDQESIARTNAESIKRILGDSATSSATSWKRATDSIVTDFERQARAAYEAARASGGTVNYTSSQRGARFAQGGSFVVPPGFPNDSFPMWVESGEHVTVIPRDRAARMPKFARGTSDAFWKDLAGLGLNWSNFNPLNYDKENSQGFRENVMQYGGIYGLKKALASGGTLYEDGSFGYGNKDISGFAATDLNNRIAASRAATVGPVKRPASRATKSTAEIFASLDEAMARRAREKAAASTSSLASTAAPASSAPTRSSGGLGPIHITIDYHPTVALGDRFELVQALRPAWEELAREYGLQKSS